MMITCVVSHGPGALETGLVCYCGAEEDTACIVNRHESTMRPEYCPTLSCEKEPAYSIFQDFSMELNGLLKLEHENKWSINTWKSMVL
jgi:hypothetical protein